jgi:cytochrome b involved in lipid metabolism
MMIYLYKILRITAWLLVIATVLSLFSGYLAIKYFLSKGIDYRNLHVSIVPWIFIPLFYIHSAIGFLNLLTRHKSTNKKSVKIFVEIIWAIVFILLILIIVAKPPAAITPGNNNSSSPGNVSLTIEEIAKHNSTSDCWSIINNKVYDLTSYLRAHPGGVYTISPYCGKDGSRGFATKDIGASHSATANNLLNSFYIGDVAKD